jgi:hypothetical protein
MSRNGFRSLVVGFVLLGALSPRYWAKAAFVTVGNASFESPPQVLNGSTSGGAGAITDWTSPTNSEGVFHPSTQVTPSNGLQVAYLDPGAGAISEALTLANTGVATLNVAANTIYTLSVDVGTQLTTGFGGYTLYLFGGNTFDYTNPGATTFASTASTVNPAAPGSLGTVTFSFTVLPGNASIGQTLGIALGRDGASGQTDFDNVRLDVSSAPSSAPEASSLAIWSILGLSVTVGARLRRSVEARKRQE